MSYFIIHAAAFWPLPVKDASIFEKDSLLPSGIIPFKLSKLKKNISCPHWYLPLVGPSISTTILGCIVGEDIEIDAIRIINEDIISIISDLPIKTVVKQRIDDIMFSNELELKKKRIEIRKLAHGKDYIEKKYIQLLLKLLEYISEV